jgi:ribonuclease III
VIPPQRRKDLQLLLRKLGLAQPAQVDWVLLDQALIHASAISPENNEVLEFVGDAALRLATSEWLRATYPEALVGELSALRSQLVSDATLSQLARQIGLEHYLVVSAAAAQDVAGEATRLADALEAVLGALYLSTRDLSLIRPWLNRQLRPLAEAVLADPARQNYKAALQEWSQGHHQELPQYRTWERSSVQDDSERFAAEVWVGGEQLGQGQGRSIKLAQQAAARQAFQKLFQSN